MKIEGYRRKDGRLGIRNHVLVLPCSVCASETARFVSANVPGTIFLPNQGGCSLSRRDLKTTLETLSGAAANPNVYGTILIGNGCEVVQAELLAEEIRKKTNKELQVFVIRECGGSIRTVEKASQAAAEMVTRAASVTRTGADVAELILGTECGGSDPTSGLVANPVVGKCSDILIAQGGTAILSETPELIGTEQILSKRCVTGDVGERLLKMIGDYEADFLNVGENPRYGNPTPGNIAGGITTLEEKSLGCIHKGGSSPITDVIGYGEPVRTRGLVVSDTPGQDIASILGMAASGAQIVVFTTGHGTPTGSAIVPVIKLTGNAETYRLMQDNIDFDCSGVLRGEQTMEEAGQMLFAQVVRTANGEQTKAERLGFGEVSIARYCNFA